MTLKSGKYHMYGDPQPDGTYQLQKRLWDGTNIQVSQRVGNEEREWARDKLGRLHSKGFLTQAEQQARDNAVVQAVTREDLNRLISDLPAHEDDWRSVREIPLGTYPVASKGDADLAMRAMGARRRGPWPLLMFLVVVISLIIGTTGMALHPTSSAVLWPSVTLVVAALFAFWAGYSIP